MDVETSNDWWKQRAALLAILLVALVIRSAGLSRESYTMDEITEIRIAHLAIGDIIVRPDGFPPLYHLLLKGWLALLGEEAARSLSALFGLVVVYGVYRLGREIGGTRVGLVAAGLTAVSPLQVWFAQEARAYALTLPLAAIAFWLFARALRTNRWDAWFCYAGVALAGLYAHYYFAILVTLHGLWFLGSLAGRVPTPWPGLLAHAALGVLALPLLGLLRYDLAFQAGSLASPFSFGDFLYTLYAFVLGFSTGLSLRELHVANVAEALRAFLPWLLPLIACLLLLVPALVRSFGTRLALFAYLTFMSLGPILLCGALASLLTVKYKVSYTAWASIPFLIAIACAITEGWRRLLPRVAIALYLLLVASSLGNRHLVDRYRNEDVRSLASYLTQNSTPDAPVFVISSYMAEPVRFYLGSDWSVRGVLNSEGPTTLGATLPDRRDGGFFWVVYTRPFHGDPHGWIHEYLTTNDRIHLEARFAGVELHRGRPAADRRAEGSS